MKLRIGKVYRLRDNWALVYFGRNFFTPWIAQYVFLPPDISEKIHGYASVKAIRKFLEEELE